MNKTKIEWVKNPDGTQGYTLNSKTGCLNHTPEGLCLGGIFPCYAYKLAHGRLKSRYLANDLYLASQDGLVTWQQLQDPFYPRWWPERLEQIREHKKPTGFFLDDMSDWMGSYWPREWTEAELQMMRDNPQHRFYTLTKQPQNLIKFSPFPENCWVGVTITNEALLLKSTTNLGYIDAKMKYISFEPLLERLPLPYYQMNCDWVIIGVLTGTKYQLLELSQKWNIEGINQGLTLMPYGKLWTLQPRLEWVEEIVRAAVRVGIPVFLKDNLKPLYSQYYLCAGRQEMPVLQ